MLALVIRVVLKRACECAPGFAVDSENLSTLPVGDDC